MKPEIIVVGKIFEVTQAKLDREFTCHKLYAADDRGAFLKQHAPKVRGLVRQVNEANKAAASVVSAAGASPSGGSRAQAAALAQAQPKAPNLWTLLRGAPKLIAVIGAVVLLSYFFVVFGVDLQKRAIALLPHRYQKRLTVEIVGAIEGELSLSGRAGGERVRGRILTGLEAGGAVRLEAVAPFGAPFFILAGRSERATLVLPRESMHQIVNTGDEPLEIVGVFGGSPVRTYLPDGSALALPWRT